VCPNSKANSGVGTVRLRRAPVAVVPGAAPFARCSLKLIELPFLSLQEVIELPNHAYGVGSCPTPCVSASFFPGNPEAQHSCTRRRTDAPRAIASKIQCASSHHKFQFQFPPRVSVAVRADPILASSECFLNYTRSLLECWEWRRWVAVQVSRLARKAYAMG
jgi:hypothetical protein